MVQLSHKVKRKIPKTEGTLTMPDVIQRVAVLRGDWPLARLCRQAGLPYEKLKKAFQRQTAPDLETLHRLARFFHVDLDWLVAGERDPLPWHQHIARRLWRLRADSARTLESWSEQAGLFPQVWSLYEQGSSAIALDYLPELGRKLGLHPLALLGEGGPGPAPELRVVAPDNLAGRVAVDPNDYVSIPLTSSAIAAGQPILQENNIEDYVLLHIRAAGKRTNLVASRVDGDSMEPMLHSGDIVVIDRNDKKIAKHKMYAVFYEEGLTAKYLERQKQWLILRPVNPSAQVQIINLYEQADPIVGRIIGAWKEL